MLGAAVAACSTAHAGGGQGEVYDLRIIALTGDAAPGPFAGTFQTLGAFTINASGQISFFAETDGALVKSGVWATRFEDPTQLRIIAGENLFPPDVPQAVRYAPMDLSYVRPSLTDDGEASFWVPLDGYPDGEREGIFRFNGEAVEAVVLPDQAVPGLPGASFASIVNLESQSSGGLIGFRAFMAGPGITEANDDALFVEWIGGLTMILREGHAAPGLPGRTWAPEITFATPQIAGNGRMTFRSLIGGGAPGAEALWTGFPGAFEPLVVTGDLLPNGRVFRSNSGQPGFASNDAGAVVARLSHGTPADTAPGIFLMQDGAIETVADAGQAGPIGTYVNMHRKVHLAPDGTVIFLASSDGPATANTALLRRRPGQPVEVLVREGDQAFGLGAGVVIDDLLGEFVQVTVDGAGRAYLRGKLRGPGINGENDEGLWMIDESGTISLVLRGQQGVAVAPSDTRYVSTIRIRSGAGPESGDRGGVNDRGDVALRVGFADGSQAIIHAFLPPFCPADRNGDGFITFDDLLIVLGDFENTGPVGTGGDADWDGDTDFDDLLIILGAFGTACLPA